jgi:hypothetical protein
VTGAATTVDTVVVTPSQPATPAAGTVDVTTIGQFATVIAPNGALAIVVIPAISLLCMYRTFMRSKVLCYKTETPRTLRTEMNGFRAF